MEGDNDDSEVAVDCDISIHSLRMEGDVLSRSPSKLYSISIHSLRMEGDVKNHTCNFSIIAISIHSLRMEGDYMRLGDSFIDSAFQSTPSAWRETLLVEFREQWRRISIHSLRMEGDRLGC